MRRRFHYQDHFIAMARERLGRERADILLVDASYRRNATIEPLCRALGVRLNMGRDENGAIEAEAYELREGTKWHGNALHLDVRIPTTLQEQIPGRRLGDVVAGTGADDWPVLWTCETTSGTTLTVDARWMDAREIRLPLVHVLKGPFRRAALMLAHEWRDSLDRSNLMPPTWRDFAFHATLIAILATLIPLSAIVLDAGVVGIALMVLVDTVVAWGIALIANGIRADIRRRPRGGG